MSTLLNTFSTVISTIWNLMNNDLLPGVSLKEIFLFFWVAAIAVWIVSSLLDID